MYFLLALSVSLPPPPAVCREYTQLSPAKWHSAEAKICRTLLTVNLATIETNKFMLLWLPAYLIIFHEYTIGTVSFEAYKEIPGPTSPSIIGSSPDNA